MLAGLALLLWWPLCVTIGAFPIVPNVLGVVASGFLADIIPLPLAVRYLYNRAEPNPCSLGQASKLIDYLANLIALFGS